MARALPWATRATPTFSLARTSCACRKRGRAMARMIAETIQMNCPAAWLPAPARSINAGTGNVYPVIGSTTNQLTLLKSGLKEK